MFLIIWGSDINGQNWLYLCISHPVRHTTKLHKSFLSLVKNQFFSVSLRFSSFLSSCLAWPYPCTMALLRLLRGQIWKLLEGEVDKQTPLENLLNYNFWCCCHFRNASAVEKVNLILLLQKLWTFVRIIFVGLWG